MYRKYPSPGRRYNYTNPYFNPMQPENIQSEDFETPSETFDIPSPNEPSDNIERKKNTLFPALGSLGGISSIFKKVKIDELILIGLLFLLINEKVEDDMLIITLLYILLAGRELF
jgi:hypothetical protein